MKKNILISIFSGFALCLVACGSTTEENTVTNETESLAEVSESTDAMEADASTSESSSEVTDSLIEESEESQNEDADYDNEYVEITADENGVLTNKYFSITLPKEAEGTYVAMATDNSISIFEKEAKEKDFGGFAFSVLIYENPGDYAGGMDVKVGEVTSSDGKVYDIVKSLPSDVQWDFTQANEDGEVKMPENYARLYEGADDIIKTLVPLDGGEFEFGRGAKGETIYPEVIAKFVQAIEEKWDAKKLEDNEMSSMYSVIGQSEDALTKCGYAFYDTNNDGIDELLVGEIAEGEWKGTVYDIYTVVDREPKHVVSGYERDRYYAEENGFITNEYSGGAGESGWISYDIMPNSTELMPQRALKYDEYTDPDNPWFVSYDVENDNWESISEEDFNFFMPTENYMRFDFTPFSEVK